MAKAPDHTIPIDSDPLGTMLPEWEGRAILLVDLDAFFASVEQLDHPDWRGKPVIVGGDADKRGVVSTCSYEAREYGVRSAMPSSRAKRLCPDAIWCHGNFPRYREVSNEVMSIIRDETPHVQQVSIDEAFADITPTRINREHPLLVANRISARVAELGVTCSIGLATSKSVAKIASDMDKPNGLTVVYPGTEGEFLSDMPIRALSGVGAVAESKLKAHGITTLSELSTASDEALTSVFGKRAAEMRARASGTEMSAVTGKRPVKSVSHERSFAEDIVEREDADAVAKSLLAHVGRRLRRKGLAGDTLTLKMRYEDRSIRSAQTILPMRSDDDIYMGPHIVSLMDKLWDPLQPVRLLGVAVSGLDADEAFVQDGLFDDYEESDDGPAFGNALDDEDSRRSLLRAFDSLKDRFGDDAVMYGGELREKGASTGSSSNNPAEE